MIRKDEASKEPKLTSHFIIFNNVKVVQVTFKILRTDYSKRYTRINREKYRQFDLYKQFMMTGVTFSKTVKRSKVQYFITNS